jgi:hypothetical protein
LWCGSDFLFSLGFLLQVQHIILCLARYRLWRRWRQVLGGEIMVLREWEMGNGEWREWLDIHSARELKSAGETSNIDRATTISAIELIWDGGKGGFFPSEGFLLSSVPVGNRRRKKMLLSWPLCEEATLSSWLRSLRLNTEKQLSRDILLLYGSMYAACRSTEGVFLSTSFNTRTR